jgi:hypothetical protein
MATEITKYLDSAGKEWPTAVEADASDAKLANQTAVEAFIQENYGKTTSNGRKSPAARAAANAIYKWIGSQGGTVELIA